MVVNNKIRVLRELHNWSQEEMAQKMNMSKNGYARIERGQGKMNLERLQQIANIFEIDITDLLTVGNNGVLFIGVDNNSVINHAGSDALVAENEKLRLIIRHKEELLEQKEIENQLLKTLVATLQKSNSDK